MFEIEFQGAALQGAAQHSYSCCSSPLAGLAVTNGNCCVNFSPALEEVSCCSYALDVEQGLYLVQSTPKVTVQNQQIQITNQTMFSFANTIVFPLPQYLTLKFASNCKYCLKRTLTLALARPPANKFNLRRDKFFLLHAMPNL